MPCQAPPRNLPQKKSSPCLAASQEFFCFKKCGCLLFHEKLKLFQSAKQVAKLLFKTSPQKAKKKSQHFHKQIGYFLKNPLEIYRILLEKHIVGHLKKSISGYTFLTSQSRQLTFVLPEPTEPSVASLLLSKKKNSGNRTFQIYQMVVSKIDGTPKSSIFIRISIINHPFGGTIIFGNIHIPNLPVLPDSWGSVENYLYFFKNQIGDIYTHFPRKKP